MMVFNVKIFLKFTAMCCGGEYMQPEKIVNCTTRYVINPLQLFRRQNTHQCNPDLI